MKEYGVFTLQRLDKGDWGIDAGLRFDSRELKTDFAKKEFDNVSASLGVFYKPAEHQFVALTLSRNGRAPTEFELFADGPHPGTGGYEVEDADLKSEKVDLAGGVPTATPATACGWKATCGAPSTTASSRRPRPARSRTTCRCSSTIRPTPSSTAPNWRASYVAWRGGENALEAGRRLRLCARIDRPGRSRPGAALGPDRPRGLEDSPRLGSRCRPRCGAWPARTGWRVRAADRRLYPGQRHWSPSSPWRTRRCACSSMAAT
ncbi:TonB-dependent receptor domain-containing protein [Caulobacter segnis]